MYWRYHLLGTPRGAEPRDSWSIVFLDDDGCISIVSDYGNWGYRWNMSGESKCIRRAMLDHNGSYLYDKLSYDHAKVFSAERTSRAVQEAIQYYRAQGELPKQEADLDSNAIQRVHNEIDFYDFLNAASGRWERYMESATSAVHNADGLAHWTTVTFPRLQARIREQLDDEAKRARLPS